MRAVTVGGTHRVPEGRIFFALSRAVKTGQGASGKVGHGPGHGEDISVFLYDFLPAFAISLSMNWMSSREITVSPMPQ